METTTFKMRIPKRFLVLYILAWVFLALTVCSLLGLLDLVTTPEEFEALSLELLMSELFHLPDLKTIILAAITILLSRAAKNVWEDHGFLKPRGRRIMITGGLCILLTFTPVSYFSTLIQFAYYGRASRSRSPSRRRITSSTRSWATARPTPMMWTFSTLPPMPRRAT